MVYDYVIVGAGTAGCVLAARLSEDPAVRVLLLEAGPPDVDPAIAMPAAYPTLFGSEYDWAYRTVPQEHLDGRRLFWAAGRTLGGGSSTGAMGYLRGMPQDFDGWRDSFGCAGWGYDDVLPYFLRAEDQQRGGSAIHGTGGPLRVEDPRFKSPAVRAWVDAARAYGLPVVRDFNDVAAEGVGFHQLTQREGRRVSAASAYLRPALARPNLTVATSARAIRVLVERGRARGVEYVRGDRADTAHAEREVVLAAGAVGSPHLLLLSGIGPADHLRAHGVPVVLDAPGVGRGLQDRPALPLSWRVPGRPALWEGPSTLDIVLWRALGRGPLASPVVEAGGQVRTSPSLDAPDLSYQVVSAPLPDQGLRRPAVRDLTVLVSPLTVGSRGSVTLLSADPRHRPAIDPAHLSDYADLGLLLHGVHQARDIAAHRPLAPLITGETAPGPDAKDDRTLRAYIRAHCGTAFHATGSLAMGGTGTAPVDPSLRLRGIDSLRVADASVFPSTPRGGTLAPALMLAERAAALLTTP